MENIVLYSNGCPKCGILQSKLDEKGIKYEKNDNLDVIVDKGFRTVPVLYVSGAFYDFAKAIKWINKN